MKIHVASLILAFLLPVCGYAQTASPRDELRQLTEQLQKTPGDNALRERIIKLGAEIKPAQALPEEANRSFVRGNVFQKEAKDVSGYELAISAYREALRIAPWWGDAYFNLAVALESANKFDEAIASIKLFMVSVPGGSTEAREAHNRIYAIEAKSEMALKQSLNAIATQAKRFEGNWYRDIVNSRGDRARLTFTVRRDAGDVWRIESSHYTDTNNLRDVQFAGSELRFKYDITLQRANRIEALAGFQATATVTPDGNTLRIAHTPLPWSSSQAAYWNSGWMKYFPGASVNEYKK